MTAIEQAREIMSRVRWQEARDGFIDYDTRKSALNAVLGLLNKHGDNALKGKCLKAINANRRVLG